MKLSTWPRAFSTILVALTALCSELHGQSTPAPAPREKTSSQGNISAAVGLNELKIEMAQTRYKLSKNPKALNDLVNALEEYLNAACLGKVLQTLTYNGNPTDPVCIERMNLLFEAQPKNPVATCVRDGMAAKSCVEAFQNQVVEAVYSGSEREGIDPALKVGLSAATIERIGKIEASLAEINSKYQAASEPEEKRALINDATNLYDQALGMACRVSSVSITAGSSSSGSGEPLEFTQTRERLLQIPSAIRKDYQVEMENRVRNEMKKSTTTEKRKEELNELLKIIKDPSQPSSYQLSSLQRTRLILDTCENLLNVAQRIVPELPAITCYREGWYTPQCLASLKAWRASKQRESAAAKGTPANKVGTPSVISTF